jgi:hypothetical protein
MPGVRPKPGEPSIVTHGRPVWMTARYPVRSFVHAGLLAISIVDHGASSTGGAPAVKKSAGSSSVDGSTPEGTRRTPIEPSGASAMASGLAKTCLGSSL